MKTTTFPLPAVSVNGDPTYLYPDLPVVSQTQKPATFDPEYDEIAPTMKLDQTVSQANVAAYYSVIGSDVVPEPSSGKVENTLPIYTQPDMCKKNSHQKDLSVDPETVPQVGIFNPG